jgi:hypothetical protein
VDKMQQENYQALLSCLGYEKLDDKVFTLYPAFIKNYNQETPFITKKALIDVINRLDLDEIHQDALIQAHQVISEDHQLHEGISFLIYILIIGAHPSHWYVKKAPEPKNQDVLASVFQLLTLLSLIPHALHTYEEKKIDKKHISFNLGHLRGYIKNYYQKHQSVGIENFGWCTYLASIGLIELKALNFMHHIYSDPYRMYENQKTKQSWMIVESDINVRKDGQLDGVNGVYDFDFKTTITETNTLIQGYKVNPYGYIERHQVTLNKDEWHLVLKKGDPVIDFHIPSKKGYALSDIKASFEAAKTFFQTHYSEFNYHAFWCVSWLYSPQLHHLIKKPESHIVDVARQGYICPATPGEKSLFTFVFQTETPDLNHITPKTSLEKNVVDYVLSGGKINTGMYIYTLNDVSLFGQRPYITAEDTQHFEAHKTKRS